MVFGYGLESVKQQQFINPLQPGNQATLCGRQEATLTYCLGNMVSTFGIDTLAFNTVKGRVVAGTLETASNTKSNLLKACAESDVSNPYNKPYSSTNPNQSQDPNPNPEPDLALFDADAITDLGDGSSLEINAKARRPNTCIEVNKEGNQVKYQDKQVNVILQTENSEKYKNALKGSFSDKQLEKFETLVETTNNELVTKGKKTRTNGIYEFDHIVPTNLLTNYGGFSPETIATTVLELTKGNPITDINNFNSTRYVTSQANAKYKTIQIRMAKEYQKAGRNTVSDLIRLLKDSNAELFQEMKANPEVYGLVFQNDQNILDSLNLDVPKPSL